MKRLWIVVALAGMAASAPAHAADVSDARQAQLLDLVENTCVTCHGPKLVGGVGPALTPTALAGKDTGMLADAIVNGRPGTPMPPFTGMIDEAEARWLAEHLKEGLPGR